MGVSDGRLCIGEASRGDIGCPAYAPTVSPTGNLAVTAGLTVNSVSLSTTGTTWGYLGSTASYIPNLNTNNISTSTINGVSVTNLGNAASPTNVPAFRVTKGGTDQALPTSTYTKLTWNTKSIDTYNNFDLGTGRFTPTIAGHYLIHLAVGCNNATQAANACVASIVKNGTKVSQQVNRAAEFDVTTDATVIVYLNGTSDYVEATAYNEAANAAITGTISYTYFEGSLLASGNGLISGTGATALSAMSDVALSSPITGQVLTYNGSEWVNRTPAASNTVSGTSTVIAGWPDALRCNITTPNSGPRIIPLSYAPWIDGRYFYRTHNGFSEYIGLIFNADGSFYANDYNTSSGAQTSSSDCSNKSISQLYAEGKAFNYIGNNGAGGGGTGDRLTSGTMAVTANAASNIISLTTNGTTWGYFGSNASYLPTLNASAISATAVQISSNTAVTCGTGNAGTLRYNNSNTSLELCTGTGWQIMGVGIPAGTISAFASTTCPTGWSEYTPARGRFLRGIDNGAGNDASGNRAPGAVQADLIGSHNHPFTDGADWRVNGGTGSTFGLPETGQNYVGTTNRAGVVGYSGGAETRPKNVAVTFCQFNGTSNGWNNPLSGGSTVPGGSTSQIQYNTSGSFDGNAGLTWTNAAQRLSATNISTTALTVNGIAITGTAEGDRISSNTTSVVAETSGLIRINTNGVNTGYFDTIGRLVTPGISSTGAISGTRGYFSRIDVLSPSNTTLQVFSTGSGVRGGMSSDIPSTGAFYVGSYSETPLALGTHNAERMRITSGGQVGIGRASPQAPLEIAGTTTARAIAQGSVGFGLISETGWNGNGIIFTNSYESSAVTHRSIVQNGGKLHFGRHSSSGHATDMFIAETGRIGIGTNSPRASLDSPRGAVFDQISVGVCAFASCPGDNNVEYPYETIQLPQDTNLRVSFGSYQPFMFGNNGHALKPGGGTWNALSDRRLKDLDGTYTHGLKQIVALEPVRFHYKKNNAMRQPSDREFVGLIAQDVLPHFPEAVLKEKDGYYRLDTTPISFAMINAVKELKSENDQLRAANDNLLKDLQALRDDFEDFKRQQSSGEKPAMSPSGRSSHIPHKNEPI
ncbi:tail fiber domain-containing protein [Agrobacterium tumefaciens]|uniref:tail fiber domain-containing protein n=1 Tax=Agrobacterium tumefaciens TaxID=358 RepID=UPI001571E095|nr:tail fiber domain-containing protein [Agrobacterium tumefaciens]NTB05785.1 tail fiber domain-containing protein [Agrobacterium tumefaciens]